MNDGKANIALIRHVTRRIDEFVYEYEPTTNTTTREIVQAFVRWLRRKEAPKTKQADGIAALHVAPDDVIDQFGLAAIAIIKFLPEGDVGIMWSSALFNEMPMPDEVREMLVEKLRADAQRLEDRTMDARNRQVVGGRTGTA